MSYFASLFGNLVFKIIVEFMLHTSIQTDHVRAARWPVWCRCGAGGWAYTPAAPRASLQPSLPGLALSTGTEVLTLGRLRICSGVSEGGTVVLVNRCFLYDQQGLSLLPHGVESLVRGSSSQRGCGHRPGTGHQGDKKELTRPAWRGNSD